MAMKKLTVSFREPMMAAVLTLLACSRSFACINGETRVLKNGTLIHIDQEGNVPSGHSFANDEELRTALHELDSIYHVTGDIDYLSDKGIVLMLLKNYKDAIELYKYIERKVPGKYSTASNIGTAYELNGDDRNALKFIQKAVEIDSASHFNSEWLHVKILKAKIGGDTLVNTHFLLGTGFGTDSMPVSDKESEELKKLFEALYYQLNERVSFVKPRDKIVAQLMFDIGNISFLLGRYGDAYQDYERAKEYGFEDSLLLLRTVESKKRIFRDTTAKSVGNTAASDSRRTFVVILCMSISLSLVLIAITFYRKRQKQ